MTIANQFDASAPFYYADGQKIFLESSRHFMAVQGGAAEGFDTQRLSASLGDSMAVLDIVELPQYHLAVIQMSETPGSAEADLPMAAVHSACHQENSPFSPGPTVFEAAESGVVEGLIPVGEVLVKFQAGLSEAEQDQICQDYHLTVQERDYPEPDAYLVQVAEGDDTLAVANRLHGDDRVDYAQPNFVRLAPRLGMTTNGAVKDRAVSPGQALSLPMASPSELEEEAPPLPTAPPTDPGFSAQWGLRQILAPEAFDISMGNPAIAIGILDDGCDLRHEDLTYRLPGYDGVFRTNDPSPLPADGHGTACAGIAAANANNGRGGSGVAPRCQVLPVRIAYGSGGRWVTSDAIIANAIRVAVDRRADVLSNSWGGGSPSSAITSAFRYAQTNGRGGRGCPIAIATGNNDRRGISYPANLSPSIRGLMAVGASNQWDERKSRTSRDGENWWGSNFGPELDVVAPGVRIYTTDIMGSGGYGPGNYIPNFNGTSSATPHVAGLMGLILSVDPDLRSWEVEDIIKLSADDRGTPGRNEEFGFGRINCRRALEAASRLWYDIRVTPEFLGSGRDCYIRLQIRVYNSGINTIRLNRLSAFSYGPDDAVLDRFDYQPNPGNVMDPRSGQEVMFRNVLLRANGNAASWSFRWHVNWGYTFWRPSAPVFPLGAGSSPAIADLSEATAQTGHSFSVEGSDSFQGTDYGKPLVLPETDAIAGQGQGTVLVDLQAKTVKISMG